MQADEHASGKPDSPRLTWADAVAAGHPAHIKFDTAESGAPSRPGGPAAGPGEAHGGGHPAHIRRDAASDSPAHHPHAGPPDAINRLQPHLPLPGAAKTARPAESGTEGLDALFARYAAEKTDDPLAGAFAKKFSVHAMGNAENPVPMDKLASAFSAMFEETPAGPVVLYIHIPFCANQCVYCGFRGGSAEPDRMRPYVDALLRELDWLGRTNAAKHPILSVFFGGGTPSVLEPEALGAIIRSVKDNFPLANDCELSLEACLKDITPERSEAFARAGFNRFSLGVQTFDTRVRQDIGRLSDRETIIGNMSHLIGLDTGAVVVDLIYGLPGQSIPMFLDDIALAEDLGVDGLDTYQLNVFPGGELDRALREGRLPPVAPLREQGRYYQQAADGMLSGRWRQISLSHFALTRRERNLYNPVVKRQGNCIGCGAGAGGFLNGWNYYRPPAQTRYLAMAEKNVFVPAAIIPPSPARHAVSEIIHQIETGFLEPDYFRSALATDLSALNPIIDNWEEAGLLARAGRRYELTRAGQFWGVNLSHALSKMATAVVKAGIETS